jgi:hypothetical protein
MSRSGYDEDIDQWALIRWRGAVKSAISGGRGQAFFRDLVAALDALPEKKLIARDLVADDGCVCALGAVGKARSIDMSDVDPEDSDTVAGIFGIADALAREVVYTNDECGPYQETPEARFERVRRWAVRQLKPEPTP